VVSLRFFVSVVGNASTIMPYSINDVIQIHVLLPFVHGKATH
jgi:hypothetical protein